MRVHAVPIAAVLAAALGLVPAAAAHVTVNPREWEAGGFARFAIRVPNERDNAATTKVLVKFPKEVLSAGFQPIEGWKRTVKMAKLKQPIEVEGEQVTEKIDTVTWSGGRILPGEFQEFGVSFRTPEEPGPSWPSRRCRPIRTARSSAGSDRPTRMSPRRSLRSPSRRPRRARPRPPRRRPKAAAPRAALRNPKATTATRSRSSR